MALIHKATSRWVKHENTDSYADYSTAEYDVTTDNLPDLELRLSRLVHSWGRPAMGYAVTLEGLRVTGPTSAVATVRFRYPLGD